MQGWLSWLCNPQGGASSRPAHSRRDLGWHAAVSVEPDNRTVSKAISQEQPGGAGTVLAQPWVGAPLALSLLYPALYLMGITTQRPHPLPCQRSWNCPQQEVQVAFPHCTLSSETHQGEVQGSQID